MSGAIFGAFGLTGPLDAPVLDSLSRESATWGQLTHRQVQGSIGLGATRQSIARVQPSRISDSFSTVSFVAAGRLDNRPELSILLGISLGELIPLSDCDLMQLVWSRLGELAPRHLAGDWAFAAWDPETRTLFVARDRSGNTAMYWYGDNRIFAFSSSRRALLKLKLASIELDELYLAQMMVSWQCFHGERTIHKQIKRLPPSHFVKVTEKKVEVTQYWDIMATPELRLPRADYVPAFLEQFDRAVRDRLPQDGPIASTLSGGLDSSSVAVTAAGILKSNGRRLLGFTSVPVFASSAFLKAADFGDELPFARATAAAAGNIDLVPVTAAGVCPIGAIRRTLSLALEPRYAACNGFWTLELRRMVADAGCRVLLTGQTGNQSISWPGDVFSQPLSVQIRILGWKRWLCGNAARHAPEWVRRPFLRHRAEKAWLLTSIHPDFSRRLDLPTRYLDDSGTPPGRSPLLRMYHWMNPAAASFAGSAQAEMGAAFGLDVRDPTGDARVLAFCASVPDEIFIDPASGFNKWLIREAMKGRLPDIVRLNRRRGRQAADLVPRLRNSTAEVNTALDEIEQGPAAEFVNLAAMRSAWALIRVQDSPVALIRAIDMLTRGIAAGLYVNGFGVDW